LTTPPPVVYLLHGEDEFAIDQFIASFEDRLGDPGTIALNTSRLDGRSLSMDELITAVSAMPILAPRRLVILSSPLIALGNPTVRMKFTYTLEHAPASTALVLAEYKTLPGNHWLLTWARSAGPRAYIRSFSLRKGAAMSKWIQDQARAAGGNFTPQAAALLASLIGEDTRLAYQEILKLVAYVNYVRPVEPEDVEELTVSAIQGDIFVLVDALGNQDGRRAMGMLQRVLEVQDPLSVFGMVVRQFRLLLLAREVLDAGGNERDVARLVKIHPYVAGKVTAQGRQFSIQTLEAVYHRLLDIDEAVKTGQMDSGLALDTLVAAFTTR
jgi:DNA polymerase-3 subunit delta